MSRCLLLFLFSACVVTAGEWHKLNADVKDAGKLNAPTAWEWMRAVASNLGAPATAPLLGRALTQAAWGDFIGNPQLCLQC